MTKLLMESPIPLYYQLKDILKKKIKENEYRIGDQLPSERELEETYGVSRMTARRALTELENEGLVYRQQGRGTFVASTKFSHHLFRLTGFTEEGRSQNLKTGAKVLRIEKGFFEIAYQKMNISPEPLICLERIRTINEEPVALEKNYIREKYCKELDKVDFNNTSLYSYFEDKCHLRLGKALQTIEARLISLKEAKILNVNSDIAVLSMERITYIEDGDIPIEFVESVYRGDKYKLTTELNRNI